MTNTRTSSTLLAGGTGALLSERLATSFHEYANLAAVESRAEQLTYRELDTASATLAHALVAAGVSRGDIIPLLVERSVALVIAQVAVLRAGAAYAPIDTVSPPLRRQAMLDLLQPRVVVTNGAADFVRPANCVAVDLVTTLSHSETHAFDWVKCTPAELAYVMFTSGTTGVPKGVMVPRSGITRLVCDANFASFHTGARWAFLSSPAFDASTLEVWAPLLNGGCCVVQDNARPSLDDIAEFFIRRRITDAWLTSSMFSAMVDDRIDAFGGVRQLLTGGERVSPNHARRLMQSTSGLRLINGYGPTENTTFTLCHTISLADTHSANGIPIGRPIHGTRVRVGSALADDGGEANGELLASGEGLALGYWNDSALTANKFITIAGARWYRTGDIVRRRGDDVFEFVGRADRQIKLQGNRIELDEVERVLERCPGVAQGVVLLRGASAETRHLIACYSGVGAAPPVDTVAEFLRLHLAPAAVPAVLHAMPQLPLTSTGKVDLATLDTLIGSSTQQGAHGRQSASNTEQVLINIWQQYLPTALIDRDTNFLAIGGTSLLALQVSSQVRRKTGRNLTPIDVLRLPVLSEQARAIDAAPLFDVDDFGNRASDIEVPLTLVQRSQLAAMQLDDSECAYLVHVAIRLEPNPRWSDGPELRRAFAALAARHASLRMVVPMEGDPTHALVQPALSGPWWNEHEVLARPPADLAWPSELLAVINRRMDLSRDGVMRVDTWPVADGSRLLVWTAHHIAMDEASIDRALVELNDLLNGTLLQPVFGSPLGFAAYEKAWTDYDAIHALGAVMSNVLRDVPYSLPRAPSRGDERPVRVPVELSARLQQACSRWGVTPFAPLLVAYGLALQEIFGSAHRFVSTPFSRRAEAELFQPIGCLLDLNVVEAGARDKESVREVLTRVAGVVIQLQRPTFLPHRALADVLQTYGGTIAQHLNGFGFTWRTNPSRTVQLGQARGQLLRVPQQGARFGVTLHTWLHRGELQCSVEAIAEAINDGRASAAGQAFLRQLHVLCGVDLETSRSRTPTVHAAREPHRDAMGHTDQLRKAWGHWMQIPSANIVDSTDFLRGGGNSLTAMRMIAGLRRELGVTIDIGAFLARPTFHNLCAMAGELTARTPDYCVVVGPTDAANLIVIFPGDLGPTLGLYSLASQIQQRLGSNYAVVAVDFESMLLRAPAGSELPHLFECTERLLAELGRERVVALAGYSSGGIVGLKVARQWPAGNAPPVWLLDTYAPLGVAQRVARNVITPFARRVVTPLARLVFRSPVARAPVEHAQKANAAVPASLNTVLGDLRKVVHAEMFRNWQQPRGDEVHLVQARQTAREQTLLWRGKTNGFNGRKFQQWMLHHVEGSHPELMHKFAGEIADLICARVRRVNRPTDAAD